MKVRLFALVNIALIPYVWRKFPREARGYACRSFRALLFAETEWPDRATPSPFVTTDRGVDSEETP